MDWQRLSRELGRRCFLRAIFFASDTWGRNPHLVEALVQLDGRARLPLVPPVPEGSAAKSGAFRLGDCVP